MTMEERVAAATAEYERLIHARNGEAMRYDQPTEHAVWAQTQLDMIGMNAVIRQTLQAAFPDLFDGTGRIWHKRPLPSPPEASPAEPE